MNHEIQTPSLYGNHLTIDKLSADYRNNIESMPTDMLVSEVRKAGFDVELEFKRRIKLRDQFGIERGDYIWREGVTDQVLEHAKEYSAKDTVRVPPHYLLLNNKLYSPRFDAFAQNFTSPIEREGSVVAGLNKVEQKLISAKNGEFVVWVSPDGKLLKDSDTSYDYSWTHVFWKEEGESAPVVRYVSLRNDFSLKEHTRLLNILNGQDLFDTDNINNTSYSDIKKVVESPVLVNGEYNIRNLGEIVSVMKRFVRNTSNVVYTDIEDKRQVSFDSMIDELSDIKKKQNLERELVAPLIRNFEDQLSNAKSYDETLRIMSMYVLALNSFYREYNKTGKDTNSIGAIIDRTLSGNFSTGLLTDMQQVKGCAATMQNTVNFTSRFTEKTITEKPFSCPACGFSTYEKIGNKCPGCGLTKEKHAEMERAKGNPVCE